MREFRDQRVKMIKGIGNDRTRNWKREISETCNHSGFWESWETGRNTSQAPSEISNFLESPHQFLWCKVWVHLVLSLSPIFSYGKSCDFLPVLMPVLSSLYLIAVIKHNSVYADHHECFHFMWNQNIVCKILKEGIGQSFQEWTK